MITEDYVSFENAKLLKEKGFDGPCYKVWESHGKLPTLVAASWFVEGETVVNRELVDNSAELYAYEYGLSNKVDGYLAPTLQMAMKWLRETHEIIPIILTAGDSQNPFYYWFRIDTIKEGKLEDAIYREDEKEFPTYEQACEAAIKYCLENLI